MARFHILNHFSRKVVFNTLLAVIFINVLITSYFFLYRPVVEDNLNTGETYVEDFPADEHQALDLSITLSNFHVKAAKYLEQVVNNKERFWLVETGLQHLDTEIPLLSIFAEEGSAGPDKITYDPRFTISAYLNELNRLGNIQEIPTLPFHWVDWVDASFKTTQIGRPDQPPLSCDILQRFIRGEPRMANFCKDKNDYSDEEIDAMGYKNRKQIPRAVITGHCIHKHPGTNAARVFMARSYMITNAPKPYKVIILNGGEIGGTYEFMVDQKLGSDQRLLFSDIGARFVKQSTKIPPKATHLKSDILKFNPRDVHSKLLLLVSPRHLAPEDDIMKMYQTVHSPKGSNKEIFLEEKNFDYPPRRIKEQIEEYEQIPERNVFQQNYLDGLKACSKYDNTNEPTYFKMAILDLREPQNTRNEGGWHYDWRFYNDALYYATQGWSKDEKRERAHIILERLLRSWNRFAEEKGIVSWIMHGPLLSWYWNGLIFPYDNDIDIQMPVSELVRLAQEYNQTLIVESPEEGYGRYFIDVSTYIHNRDRSRTENHIDARFIDVDSGIYIDITGLAKSPFNLPPKYDEFPIVDKDDNDPDAEVYNDRRKHFYTLPQLLPLRYSMMDGVPVYIPHEIDERLVWEYRLGLESHQHRGWYFVPQLQLWISKEKLLKIFDEKDCLDEENIFDPEMLVDKMLGMSDEEALQLLEDDATLREYYLTSNLTAWHTHEKTFLFTEDGMDNLDAFKDPEFRQNYNNFVAGVKFYPPLRKALYEYEQFDRTQHH